jgi:iron complex transport system ATP-binding protein
MNAIEISDLSFSYGTKQVVKGVDLQIPAGKIVSIVGPNGSGKTTLLRCVMRVLNGFSGQIRVAGKSLETYTQKELAQQVAYVPQSSEGFFSFTVREMVLMGRYPFLSPLSPVSAADHQAVENALSSTGTLQFADRRMDHLSGGERQKVMIAAAIAQGSGILLLDEPTTFLDYRHQQDVRQMLVERNRQHAATIVMVTHDLNTAALISDKLVALREGEVVAQGTTSEVMQSETLREIYGTTLLLAQHPQADVAMILPSLPPEEQA